MGIKMLRLIRGVIVISLMAVLFYETIAQLQYVLDKTDALQDKALDGFTFQNLTQSTIDKCFLSCIENCRCMAFQICNETECQLLSSNKDQSRFALITKYGCSYYEVQTEGFKENSPNEFTYCTSQLSCCLTSNPCINGGTCEPTSPTNKANRFACKSCPSGFTGNLCQQPIRSCRGYINGTRVPGKYKIFDDTMTPFDVLCDFDENTTMAWTLMQSYQLQYKMTFNKGFQSSLPVNESSPNWVSYRVSKSRMLSIQQDSSKWRWTCQYDTDGVVYTDYLQVDTKNIDIFADLNGVCKEVEFIDIRGIRCKNCTARFYQVSSGPLHVDASASGCDFHLTNAILCINLGEDSFGLYQCVNSAHRCSSSSRSTTQIWFGAV